MEQVGFVKLQINSIIGFGANAGKLKKIDHSVYFNMGTLKVTHLENLFFLVVHWLWHWSW